MTYKTTIIRTSFWFKESKKTAQYMLQGLTKQQIREKTLKENTYQTTTPTRSKEIANTTYNRLKTYSPEILEQLQKTDVTTAKILVLISIMTYDQLFYEFMKEVYHEHILFGNNKLTRKDVNKFLEEKKQENQQISNWSNTVYPRINRTYLTILREAGILKEDNTITTPYIDIHVENQLEKNKLKEFLNIFKI